MEYTRFARIAQVAVVGLLLGLGATQASAALITGALTFSGDFETDVPLGGATSLSFPGNDFGVDGATGDYSGISQGDIGSIADFDLTGPIAFDVGGFSFVIDDIFVFVQTDAFLLLNGVGTASAVGFDDTGVLFSLSGNVNGELSAFSAGVTAIPVPGALLLMGSALGWLGLRRRR